MMPSNFQKERKMPLDRTAHFSGTFAEAEQRSTGFDLSVEERIFWASRAIKAAFGLDPDKPVQFDKTVFSMRKNS
jgi:hypothetical protein